MPAGEALPQTVDPYLVLMLVGFGVGAFGHLMRSRLLVAVGITLVFLATLLFPLALNVFNDSPPPPPGPVATP
jgi:hypothetical protein